MCVSHYHDDHLLGFDEIIERYAGPETYVLIPDVDREDSLSEEAVKIRKSVANITKNGRKNMGKVRKVCDPCIIFNQTFFVKNNEVEFEITALSPISNITARNIDREVELIDQNDYSISLLIKLGELKLLFTGDVTNSTLGQIEEKYDINFLKIPHHGSKGSDKIFEIANLNKDSVCVSTNYKLSNLPNFGMLNMYADLSNEVYITRKDSSAEKEDESDVEENYGIIHTKYELDISSKNIFFDVKELHKSKKYKKEKMWIQINHNNS